MSAPLIAIPAARIDPGEVQGWRPGAFAVAETYMAALKRAGARPALLTGPDADPAEEILERFDGVLLTGGGDFHPSTYGATAHSETFDIQVDRDQLELELVRGAHRLGLPVLGICRGLQAINIAFGGTLVQHLPDLGGAVSHGEPAGGGPVVHDARVQPGSKLAGVMGAGRVAGVARHHQGIELLGEDLVATAWTDDGVIEGIEHEDDWIVAVQWHPEVTAATDATQQALFDALVKRAWRHSR